MHLHDKGSWSETLSGNKTVDRTGEEGRDHDGGCEESFGQKI